MIEFFEFLSVIIISTVIFTLVQAAASIIFNIKIDSVQLGYGKSIGKLKLRSFDILFGWIPGGSVNLNIDQFNQRSIYVRWFIIATGPLSVLLSSALFLSIEVSFSELVRAFSQIYNLTLYPSSYGQNLFTSLTKFLSEANYFQVYGVLAAKVAAMNLLPFPTLAGGRIILEAIPLNIKTKIIITNISLIIVLGMFCSILYAFILYLF